ncbi:MAG: hypothetical protein ACM3ON_06745 [Chloroflexota bacterium]
MNVSTMSQIVKDIAESCICEKVADRVTFECAVFDDWSLEGLQRGQLCDAVNRILSHAAETDQCDAMIRIYIEQILPGNEPGPRSLNRCLMLYAEGTGMTILMAY